jgi:hypothetical protein
MRISPVSLSNKPNRRIFRGALGAYSTVYAPGGKMSRLPGFAGLGNGTTGARAATYEMSGDQVAAFLLRHPLTAATVAATKAAMLVLTPDQIQTPPAWYQIDVPLGLVPPWGISVQDSQLGNVLVDWDKNLNWHYTAFSPVSSSVIDEGQYYSPTGDGTDFLTSLSQTLGSAVGTIETAALLIGGLWLWNSLRK